MAWKRNYGKKSYGGKTYKKYPAKNYRKKKYIAKKKKYMKSSVTRVPNYLMGNTLFVKLKGAETSNMSVNVENTFGFNSNTRGNDIYDWMGLGGAKKA